MERVELEDEPGLAAGVALGKRTLGLKARVQALESESRTRRDLMSLVSHEIRAPLAIARGYCQMVAQGDLGRLPPTAGRAMAIALTKLAEIETMSQTLLELTRADGERMAFQMEPVNILALCREAVEAFAVHPAARERVIHVRGQELVAMADPAKLESVLQNLLSNAVKYSPPETPVEVSVAWRRGRIELVVADRGPGIPARQRGRLFQRFQRLLQCDADVPGIGLGLFITRIYVEGMGGNIRVTGRRGGGACFRVDLAAAKDAA